MPPTILIVDDEAGIRESLSSGLQEDGYSVETIGSGEECLEFLTRKAVDLILLDVWLPGIDGMETLAAAARNRIKSDGSDDLRSRKYRICRQSNETRRL